MAVPADDQPRFDPARYPGARPPGPVLLWRGHVHPVDPLDLTVPPTAADAPVLADPDRRWVVAYGSNASADRLVDKGLERNGCLLLDARVAGWQPAWEARRTTSTGAVPLTLVPAPDTMLDAHVLGVHPDDLDRLDRGEFRGRNYDLGSVGSAALAARWLLEPALAFGPGPSTRVLTGEDAPLTIASHDQRAARTALDKSGGDAPVEPLPDVVAAGWPRTDLRDLDLFVYGTLQPGESRWPQIEGLVDVVGPATTGGRLTSTPMGWPAGDFGHATSGTVHGTLLRARSRDAATSLFRTADEIEGAVGDGLFRRVAVHVDGPEKVEWAAVYEWDPSNGDAPGDPIPDGTWNRRQSPEGGGRSLAP